MDRVKGADWFDIGGGRRGFRAQNATTGVPGTEVTDVFLNNLQEEILKVVEAAGLVPNAADMTQLWQALNIRQMSGAAFKQASTVVLCSRTLATGSLVTRVNTIQSPTNVNDDGQGDFEINGSSVKCLKAGRYLINGVFSMNLNVGAAGGTFSSSFGIQLNGAETNLFASSRLKAENLVIVYGGGGEIRDLVVGDAFQFFAFADSGVSGTVPGGPIKGSLSILRLAV